MKWFETYIHSSSPPPLPWLGHPTAVSYWWEITETDICTGSELDPVSSPWNKGFVLKRKRNTLCKEREREEEHMPEGFHIKPSLTSGVSAWFLSLSYLQVFMMYWLHQNFGEMLISYCCDVIWISNYSNHSTYRNYPHWRDIFMTFKTMSTV